LGADVPWAITKSGAITHTEGGGDATIIAYGALAWQSLEAARLLENEGFSVRDRCAFLQAAGCRDAAAGVHDCRGGGFADLTWKIIRSSTVLGRGGGARAEKRYDARG